MPTSPDLARLIQDQQSRVGGVGETFISTLWMLVL